MAVSVTVVSNDINVTYVPHPQYTVAVPGGVVIAQNAADRAAASAAAAENSEDLADSHRIAAAASAAAANDSEGLADEHRIAAAASEAAAAVSEGLADEHRIAAGASEAAAAVSEGLADEHRIAAAGSAAAASTSESLADGHRIAAAQSESNAADSASDAEDSESLADSHRIAAAASAEAADTSEGLADDHRIAAAASAAAAAGSATAAASSEGLADDHRIAAAGSAAAAAGSATAANTSRVQAQAARDASQAAQAASELAQGKAEDAQQASETAQGLAEAAQGSAEDAQVASELARDESVTAKNQSESARDESVTARNQSQTARNQSQTAQGLSEDARDAALGAQSGAEAAEQSAASHASNASDSAADAHASAVAAALSEVAAKDYKDIVEQIAATMTSSLYYAGVWDASTEVYPPTPTDPGYPYYKVTQTGVINGVDYNAGDSIIWDGSSYFKIDSTDQVASVNGYIGAVVLNKSDVGLGNVPNVNATNASNISSGTLPAARLPATINADTTGNAATASKLATPRTITLNGDVTGSATFDGSSNAGINVTVQDDSHNHVIANIDGLQAALDSKTDVAGSVTSVAGRTGAVVLTKDDVGLGNVPNWRGADLSEAQSGELNYQFMTPLRTHQAFNQYGLGLSEGTLPTVDANSVLETGWYRCVGDDPNNPFGQSALLDHRWYGPNHRSQIMYGVGSFARGVRSFQRTYVSGSWSPWAERWTDANQLALGTTPASARTALELGGVARWSPANEAQAIAGVSNNSGMTPLRTHQAFNQYGLGKVGTQVTDWESVAGNGTRWYWGQQAANSPTSFGGITLGRYEQYNQNHGILYVKLVANDESSHGTASYTRAYVGGVWQSWVTVYDSQNQLALGTTPASARTALGLGGVAQWSPASEAQAIAGASNNSGMTPLRVHQAFKQYGLGTTVQEWLTVDCNEMKTAGTYAITSESTNKPAGSGILEVRVVNGLHLQQTFYTPGNGRSFERSSWVDGTWKPWAEVWTAVSQLALGNTPGDARSALALGNAATHNYAPQGTAEAGTSTTHIMSPLRTHQAFNLFGLGSNSPLPTYSADDVDRTRWFRIDGADPSNPVPGTGLTALHINHGSGNQVQLAYRIHAGSFSWRRVRQGGTWHPWVMDWNANNQLALGTTPESARTAIGTIADDDPRLSDAREWTAPIVSVSAVEAGTETAPRKWNVLRVWQAAFSWWNQSSYKTKLDGIATGATKNATDAQLRDRGTHTGAQAISTVTGLQAALDSKADASNNWNKGNLNFSLSGSTLTITAS